MTAAKEMDDKIGIIILLGNESDETGLSEVARSRCEKTVELAASHPDYLILPTGSFGKFNKTDRPHGDLLREYLIKLGVEASRVLPFTNSTNTIEDALFSRPYIVDLKPTDVLVVTSNFHLQRASYIFRRIFPDFQLKFFEANGLSASPKQWASEENKLKILMREWIDAPLYGYGKHDIEFHGKIYTQASIEHKHYDTLSIAVISGQFILFAYPYVANFSLDIIRASFFVLSALSILALALIYNRMAWSARVARRVVHNIEAQHGGGFSLNYPRQDRSSRPRLVSRLLDRGSSITYTVRVLMISMITVQIMAAVFSAKHGIIFGYDLKNIF